MKIKVIALATFVSAVFVGSAMAYDGTITFTGKVVAQTCNVTTGNDGNFTVTLPTVSNKALASPGETTGLTPFSINLTVMVLLLFSWGKILLVKMSILKLLVGMVMPHYVIWLNIMRPGHQLQAM